MANGDDRIQKELTQQALRVNPFRSDQPQAQTPTQVGRESLSPVQNPFDAMTLIPQQGSPLEGAIQRIPGPTLRETLQRPVTPDDRELSRKVGLEAQLTQTGLGNVLEGLTFDSMGKMQLLARLQRQFGENFEQNPVANRILATFDRNIPKEKTQSDEDREQQRFAAGQRTLEALFRGL